MVTRHAPNVFMQLLLEGCIKETDIRKTQDGFWFLYKSLSDILSVKEIFDFPNSNGARLECRRFYDDWFLYAVQNENEDTYSLLKLREQEYDAVDGVPADGDVPGVTVSFIAFDCERLLDCLKNPTDENRRRLDREINRVVVHRGQSHHKALKRYFIDPRSEGAYLVAAAYTTHIASFAEHGELNVPEHYKVIVEKHRSHKNSAKWARLPHFMEALNREAGCLVCDNEKLYIKNPKEPTAWEAAAILATHTGNTSMHSFAAEVEFHAKFLVALFKIKIPFFGRSIYDSAIRADMTIYDAELEGPTPYHRSGSQIVKRQRRLHPKDA